MLEKRVRSRVAENLITLLITDPAVLHNVSGDYVRGVSAFRLTS